MGFLDSLFGKKPTKKDITAFNYYLFFDYIPKRLYEWQHNNVSIQSALTFDSLIQKNPVWKSLVKKITVTDSTLTKCTDITAYLVKAPSTEFMGEVAMAMFTVNPKIRKYEYYTMEYSLGDFAICSADEEGNHYNIDGCKNGEIFGAYVVRQALKNLVPSETPKPKPAPKPQPSSAKSQQSSPKPQIKHTAESFLKTLEKIANQYYQERGVVSLEDWMVTKKEGDSFKFYITQYPDAEFEDPNCEVTLMVEFMDHNGRMGVVNKFFPKQAPAPQKKSDTKNTAPQNIIGKYYSLDQLRQVPMGQVRLQPIDGSLVVNTSAQTLISVMAGATPDIKKYLPNLDLSSAEAVAKYFSVFCMKTEMGYEFGYSIKTGDDGFLGFIFVHTPAQNEIAINFPHWTIDFCIFSPFAGQGIMAQSLVRVLFILKSQMNVNDVFVYVDENNTKCLNLLAKLPFDRQPETLTDPITGHKAILFCCPLHSINFQRR